MFNHTHKTAGGLHRHQQAAIKLLCLAFFLCSGFVYGQESGDLSFYEYDRSGFHVNLILFKRTKDFSEYWVTFPSPVVSENENLNTVKCYYFTPVGKGLKFPAVVVLHTWGAAKVTNEKRIGQALAREGIASLVLVFPYHMDRRVKGQVMITADVEHTVQATRQAILDIRRAGDWLCSQKDVDCARLGVAGISLGGILTHLVMGVDERFKVGVSILGGGNVAKIIWKGWITRKIKKRISRQGYTLPALEEKMRLIDPGTFSSRNRPRKVFMINSLYDFVIPRSVVKDLWEQLGHPRILWLTADHFTPMLIRDILIGKTVQFFKQEFKKAG